MLRNGESFTQNKERSQILRPHPSKGYQVECGATSHCGIFSPISRSYCYGLRVWFTLEFVI